MDFKDLRYFIAVYEARGFSKASEALGTVQSNVSARILNLEQSLGGALFERQWRRVIPTEKGEKFYTHAKETVAALDDTARKFKLSGTA
jgi:DNA-binding transcriptional LysR family regulator